MQSINTPYVESEKITIKAEIERRSQVLQESKSIEDAWVLALQQLFPDKAVADEMKARQKKLEKKLTASISDDLIHNFLLAALREITTIRMATNLQSQPIGVILFPQIWQAAVDHTITNTTTSSTVKVTAANEDVKRLRNVLSASTIQVCNATIVQMLLTKIWTDPNILSIVAAHVGAVADQAKVAALHNADESGAYLITASNAPIAHTWSMAAPQVQGYETASFIFYQSSLRGLFGHARPNFAAALGTETRRLCRQWMESAEFTTQVLPDFVCHDLLAVQASSAPTRQKGLFGRFR